MFEVDAGGIVRDLKEHIPTINDALNWFYYTKSWTKL